MFAKLTSLSAINTILLKGEILERPDLVKVILDLLNDSWCPILAKIVHGVEGLENSAPLFLLGLDFCPQVLHNDSVVLPVVCMISEHLKLAVRDIPVLIWCCFVQNSLVLSLTENATSLVLDGSSGAVKRIDHGVLVLEWQWKNNYSCIMKNCPIKSE